MKHLFCSAIFVVAASFFATHSLASEENRQSTLEEIPVGVVLPFTGANATTGLSMKIGMDIALAKVNQELASVGKKIRYFVADTRSTPEGAVEAYEYLIETHGVVALLGPFTSTGTKMAAPVAQKHQVISFSPSSAAEGLSALGDYVFRSSLTVSSLVSVGIEVSKEVLGYKNVATIVNSADTFSASNDVTLHAEFANRDDLTVVSKAAFSRPADMPLGDISETLKTIKEADPDALFVSSLPTGRIGVMVQAREMGWDVPLVYTLLTMDEVKKAKAISIGAAEGAYTFQVWLPGVKSKENEEFKAAHRALYDMDPDSNTARSYAAVTILAKAIADAKGSDAASLRDALAEVKDYPTIFGNFSFDQNGDAIYMPVVAKVVDGTFAIIEKP